MIPSLRETASAQALQHRFCHHPQCAIELNVGINAVNGAYFHERRSLNNFHRDRVITFEQIAE